MSPHARSTSTSHAPRVAAAAPPRLAYTAQRHRAVARVRLGRTRSLPARTATAATAAPAPAPAPRTHVGGAAARKSAARPRMITSPGTMKAMPPTIAPAIPATRQAEKMASCVDAGPGSRLHAAIASSKSCALSHRRRSMHRSRNKAMWAGGPPKPVMPMRPHCARTVHSDGRAALSRAPGPLVIVRWAASACRRLEQLYDVARWILEEDLLAARPFDNVVAERRPRRAESCDFGAEVVDDEVDAIPASGLGLGAVGHWPTRGAGRSREQESEVAAFDVGERGRGAREQLEAEHLGVEGDRIVDVVDHVTDVDGFIVSHALTSL